jgi:hypothetical protein
LTLTLNAHRDSKNDEKPEFWIAYFLLGYQGNEGEDADGDDAVLGISKRLLTSTPYCDCYQSATSCPSIVAGTPAPVSCSILPTGSFGTIIYQEVQQDFHRTWLLAGRTFDRIAKTGPHELGHQFGLNGDQFRPTFKIMDYSEYTTSTASTVINEFALHAEHINIIRRRTKSPGEN